MCGERDYWLHDSTFLLLQMHSSHVEPWTFISVVRGTGSVLPNTKILSICRVFHNEEIFNKHSQVVMLVRISHCINNS